MFDGPIRIRRLDFDDSVHNCGAGRRYVAGLVEENLPLYEEVFGAHKERVSVYSEVEAIIGEVERVACRVHGITQFGGDDIPNDVRLGWSRIDSSRGNAVSVTDEGKRVVDGYRASIGMIPVDELRAINCRRGDAYFRAAAEVMRQASAGRYVG